MKKKVEQTIVVKPILLKPLKAKLMDAMHKVLKENKAELTIKIERIVNKSIKKIVKKIDKQFKKAVKISKSNLQKNY
jgi:hypothetical protein